MKKIIIGILVTFLSVPAFARTISGTVVDKNNVPVKDAIVYVLGGGITPATTNAQGRYTLINVPDGQISIQARAQGYFTSGNHTIMAGSDNITSKKITLEKINAKNSSTKAYESLSILANNDTSSTSQTNNSNSSSDTTQTQNNIVNITGTVIDSSTNKPINGANVQIQKPITASLKKIDYPTNNRGIFQIKNLVLDSDKQVILKIAIPGYQTKTHKITNPTNNYTGVTIQLTPVQTEPEATTANTEASQDTTASNTPATEESEVDDQQNETLQTDGISTDQESPAASQAQGNPVKKDTNTEPRLSKEESQQKIDELQENYDKVKENEQSWANKSITAASTAATGIGASMALSALSEQNADAAAERDMKAYLATFRCTYGTNQVRGGEKGVFLPGGNVLLPLYTEYVNLADSLKERKNALGMMPGIESEVIIDKSTAGLYDDELMGKNNGTFISLADAFLNPTGESAQAWAAQQAQTAETLKAGLITAGAGIATGIIGNAIVNRDAYKDRSDEIERQFALLEQMETNINSLPPTPPSFDININLENNNSVDNPQVPAETIPTSIQTITQTKTIIKYKTCPDKQSWSEVKQACECTANYVPDNNGGCKCPDYYTDMGTYCKAPDTPTTSITLYNRSLFDLDSSTVKPEAEKIIKDYFNKLKPLINDPFTFFIVGYTDSTGEEKYNEGLGQRRADAVKAVLEDAITEADITEKYSIYTQSNGEKDCQDTYGDKQNREDCRKVTITYAVDSTEIQQSATQQ